MATVAIQVSNRFPVGTEVKAYLAAGQIPDGHPSGTEVEAATVESDGKVKYTGLTANVAYVLWAEVAGEHRYIGLSDSSYTAPGNLKERLEAIAAVTNA